jgi:restriction system protein
VEDGSQEAAAIIARNEQHRRQQQAAIQSSAATPEWVPVPRPQPVYLDDGSQDAAAIVAMNNEYRRRQNFAAILASMQGGEEVYVPPDDFPVLVSQTVITPYGKTDEGQLIRAVMIPLRAIIQKIMKDPSRMYEIDPRKWEEIIVASYEASGLFDEVTLTPRSGDHGKDLIAVKKGLMALRVVESVKRYTPGHLVTAEEVDALIGVMNKQPQTNKGIISTTWEFAPKLMDDPDIARLVPTRLQLLNGAELMKRLVEFMNPKSK